ncbi:MAG: chaperone modulator CbpM [Chitinophagales bacterium]
MEVEQLVPIKLLCSQYNLEPNFFILTSEFGLIELKTEDGDYFIPVEQVKVVETIMHLHIDLDINIEGVEAIFHLLDKVNNLQEEVTLLRHKIDIYESEW